MQKQINIKIEEHTNYK